MRTTHEKQASFIAPPVDHQLADELEAIDQILDANPAIRTLVLQDLCDGVDEDNGRQGLSAERVLRCLILKQWRGFSYDKLAFHLKDSRTFRWFVGFGLDEATPAPQTLQQNIAKVRPETLSTINDIICRDAENRDIEDGDTIRTDCTVVESNIHPPSDSSLLFDVVKTAVRLLTSARKKHPDIDFSDHTRATKKRMIKIQYAKRTKERKTPYKVLVNYTRKTLGYIRDALETVGLEMELKLWRQMNHLLELGEQVIDQTKRRVFDGESVPADEKIVSIFEPHTDIIVKDWRNVYFGHKVCLSSGQSGLITDCVVETGNPNDAKLFKRTLDNHVNVFGQAPSQCTADGGFSSEDNLQIAKAMDVDDVVFTKSPGIERDKMVRKPWIYRQMQKFRAGIESAIAYLKRTFGLSRCDWRGWASFRRYVQASVLSCNLVVVARHLTG